MNKLYLIEGGLGKQIAFTALMQKLAQKQGEKLRIISPYPDLFYWSPFVEKVYHAANYEQERQEDERIEYLEPYKCEYHWNNQHICAWWAERMGIVFDPASDKPSVPLGQQAIDIAHNALLPYEGKRIGVVQFSGGQSPEGYNNQELYMLNDMRLARNYPLPMANILMRKLAAQYPDVTWLNFALPNEPQLACTVKIELPYIAAFVLAERAEMVVSIDSSLAHICAAVGKRAVVLWNEFAWAKPHKIGWQSNTNLIAPNMEHDYADILRAVAEWSSDNG